MKAAILNAEKQTGVRLTELRRDYNHFLLGGGGKRSGDESEVDAKRRKEIPALFPDKMIDQVIGVNDDPLNKMKEALPIFGVNADTELEEIGEGAFGTVYAVGDNDPYNIRDGEFVIKHMKFEIDFEYEMEELENYKSVSNVLREAFRKVEDRYSGGLPKLYLISGFSKISNEIMMQKLCSDMNIGPKFYGVISQFQPQKRRSDKIVFHIYLLIERMTTDLHEIAPYLNKRKNIDHFHYVEEQLNILLTKLDEMGLTCKDMKTHNILLTWKGNPYTSSNARITKIRLADFGDNYCEKREDDSKILNMVLLSALVFKKREGNYTFPDHSHILFSSTLTDPKYKKLIEYNLTFMDEDEWIDNDMDSVYDGWAFDEMNESYERTWRWVLHYYLVEQTGNHNLITEWLNALKSWAEEERRRNLEKMKLLQEALDKLQKGNISAEEREELYEKLRKKGIKI